MGVTFGKYELLERIGAGGMSEVYRARLPGVAGFEKIVVVKRLLPQHARDPGMVELFVGEAKLAAQVHHPHVVQVFELDRATSGEFYIVMEYIEGTDLRRLIRYARNRKTPIPPWLAVYVVSQVLDGLSYVHSLVDKSGKLRNVVHRDVSPDNIFISHFGDVKLGDFGVAKDDMRGIEPYAEQLKGKFAYMAPEQLTGKGIDARCDVFAAGVVLWETLTRQPLFRGKSNPETMIRVCQAKRVPPSTLAENIPPELDRIVLDALEIDPAKRIECARDMQSRLLEVLPSLKSHVGPLEVRRTIDIITGGEVTPPQGTERVPKSIPPVRGTQEIEDPSVVASELVDDDKEDSVVVDIPAPPMSADMMSPAAIVNASDNIMSRPPPPLPPPDPATPATDPERDATRYVIINPKYKEQSATPISARGTETDDFIGKNLSYEMPMPGRPSNVETADIIARRARAAAISVPDPLDAVPPWSSSQDRGAGLGAWSPHQGTYPFWLRAHGNVEFGPCSLTDLMLIVRSKIADTTKAAVDISGDRASWMPLSRFLRLTAQDVLDPRPEVAVTAMPTLIRAPNIIALFGQISETRPTGRFLIYHGRMGAHDDRAPGAATEVHVIDGKPTHVIARDASLETPGQLIRHRVVDEAQLAACMHAVVTQDRSIRQVILQDVGIDVEDYWIRFMVSRLEPLIQHDSTVCRFSPVSPEYLTPFAPSVLSLLPQLVHRVKSGDDLRAELAGTVDINYERTPRFEKLLSELELTESQLEAINPIGQTRTLQEAFRVSIGGDKYALTMGYIMLRLEMLRPRMTSPAL